MNKPEWQDSHLYGDQVFKILGCPNCRRWTGMRCAIWPDISTIGTPACSDYAVARISGDVNIHGWWRSSEETMASLALFRQCFGRNPAEELT